MTSSDEANWRDTSSEFYIFALGLYRAVLAKQDPDAAA